MHFKKFIQTVIYAALGGMLLYSLLCIFLPLYSYLYLSMASLLLFLSLAIIIYFLGQRAILNPIGSAFLSIIMLNTFLKLIASFVFVFAYVKLYEPQDKLFIIPFFIYYLSFTIAETYFLSVQAKKRKD